MSRHVLDTKYIRCNHSVTSIHYKKMRVKQRNTVKHLRRAVKVNETMAQTCTPNQAKIKIKIYCSL